MRGDRQPNQGVRRVEGRLRFRPNQTVKCLFERTPHEVWRKIRDASSDEDLAQLGQLIGMELEAWVELAEVTAEKKWSVMRTAKRRHG